MRDTELGVPAEFEIICGLLAFLLTPPRYPLASQMVRQVSHARKRLGTHITIRIPSGGHAQPASGEIKWTGPHALRENTQTRTHPQRRNAHARTDTACTSRHRMATTRPGLIGPVCGRIVAGHNPLQYQIRKEGERIRLRDLVSFCCPGSSSRYLSASRRIGGRPVGLRSELRQGAVRLAAAAVRRPQPRPLRHPGGQPAAAPPAGAARLGQRRHAARRQKPCRHGRRSCAWPSALHCAHIHALHSRCQMGLPCSSKVALAQEGARGYGIPACAVQERQSSLLWLLKIAHFTGQNLNQKTQICFVVGGVGACRWVFPGVRAGLSF